MAIEGLPCLLCRKIGREAIDLAVFNANVETIDRSLIRTSQTDVFYDEIEQFRHAAFFIRWCMLITRVQNIVLCWIGGLLLITFAYSEQFRRPNQIIKSLEIEHSVAKRLRNAMCCQRGVIFADHS